MLKGLGITAYRDIMNKSMTVQQEEKPEKPMGLLSRNKTVDKEDEVDSDTYVLEQFKTLKKLRAEMQNG
tara:strand:- start:335 stop:541 length:207 start_codon:yes stop_codon:yes gene_type:complete